jgi:hypothetical protein
MPALGLLIVATHGVSADSIISSSAGITNDVSGGFIQGDTSRHYIYNGNSTT